MLSRMATSPRVIRPIIPVFKWTPSPLIFVQASRCISSSSSFFAGGSNRSSKKRRPSTSSRKPIPPPSTSAPTHHSRQNGQPYDDSYMLCDQVRLLSSRNRLDAAIELVQRTPAPTTTIVVWNVLLNEVLMHSGDPNKAYELWMGMKRRGFAPSSRSFGTYFRGLASLAQRQRQKGSNKFIGTSTTLSRARTIYAQWLTYLERTVSSASSNGLSFDSASDDEISILPANHYLAFLGHTDRVDLLLETFSSLPTSGPVGANSATYSLVLGFLRSSSSPEHFKLAIDIFNRMLTSLPPSSLDVRTISIVLAICREQARPDDQAVGLPIIERTLGLVPPSSVHLLSSPSHPRPLLKMDPSALSSALTLLLKIQRYNLCVEWFDQVRDFPERFGPNVIEVEQCDLVLNAYVAKKGAPAAEDLLTWMSTNSLTPTHESYSLALKACWKAVDLPRAYRVLSRMTGLPLFKDVPPSDRPAHKALEPNPESLSYFLLTALGTRDKSLITSSLTTFLSPRSNSGLGGHSHLLASAPTTASSTPQAYWIYHLHSCLYRALSRILESSSASHHLGKDQVREWSELRDDVEEWLDEHRHAPKEGEEESMEKRRGMIMRSRKEGSSKRDGEGRGGEKSDIRSGHGERRMRDDHRPSREERRRA